MQRFTFKKGLCFIDGQIRWELDRRLPSGKLQLCSDDGEVLNLTYSEVLQRWQSQEWIIDESCLGSLKDIIYIVSPRDLATYPVKIQEVAKRRLHYLTKLDPVNTPYNVSVWSSRIQKIAMELNDDNPPSTSTVANWWRRYRQTRSVLKLIPWNRPASIHQAKPAYVIFEEILAEVYLTDNKLPKLIVFERLLERIQKLNLQTGSAKRITCPSRSTIYRWLENLQQDLVDLAREGSEVARMKYRSAIGSVKTRKILERTEIDHTPLDLIIIDPVTSESLGRPWVTFAIDHYSRMVTGFYISISPPSANSLLQCMRRMILPKDQLLAHIPHIKNSWPAHGIPETIAVDNGADLHSTGFEHACLEMGIELLFCGSKIAYHKGAIERFIRTNSSGLIHTLPGTVFSNPEKRGDYASEDKACLDMKLLTQILILWIVDVYNVTPHRGTKSRPLDLWTDSAKSSPIALPIDPQQLELVTGIRASRTLFHYGIEFEGLYYNDQNLQLIRRRVGKNIPVDIKYYEDDVSFIHVLDPDSKFYIRVQAKEMIYAEKTPREIHRTIRAHQRKQINEQSLTPDLLDSKKKIYEMAKSALLHKKMGYRKLSARQVNLNSEVALKAQDPLAAVRKPLKSAKSAKPNQLPSGLQDDFPILNVSVKKGDNK